MQESPVSARVFSCELLFQQELVKSLVCQQESCVPARVVAPIVVPARVGVESCVPARIVVPVVIISARVGVSK